VTHKTTPPYPIFIDTHGQSYHIVAFRPYKSGETIMLLDNDNDGIPYPDTTKHDAPEGYASFILVPTAEPLPPSKNDHKLYRSTDYYLTKIAVSAGSYCTLCRRPFARAEIVHSLRWSENRTDANFCLHGSCSTDHHPNALRELAAVAFHLERLSIEISNIRIAQERDPQ
jgi:hypothetical protein